MKVLRRKNAANRYFVLQFQPFLHVAHFLCMYKLQWRCFSLNAFFFSDDDNINNALTLYTKKLWLIPVRFVWID